MGSTTGAVRPEPAARPGSSDRQDVYRDQPVGRTRVAVIDRRSPRRAELARAVATEPDLELALSSDCMQDAMALLTPLDLILLGECRGRRGSTCDMARSVAASGGTTLVVLDSEARTDGDAVRQALESATGGEPSPTQPAEPPLAALPACPSLSAQEGRALALYSSGLTLDAVAAAMYVSPNTAATYLRRVRAKFRAAGSAVDSKLELRELAIAHGLLEGRKR